MKKANNEQRYFDALKRIATAYECAARVRRQAETQYGLPEIEALEMAYDNIRAEAKMAIKGRSRPGGDDDGI